MQSIPCKIGTRGSKLALAQAYEARQSLMDAHGMVESDFEIVIIKTEGDKVLNRSLSEIGGKGLFTKEIEEALLDGRIDMAVHSAKDMPSFLPDGLTIAAYLPREDARDGFLSYRYTSLSDMPPGAIVGTSSLRRQALAKILRPDLKIVPFRGNVQLRLEKLEKGVADATFLACAGLKRLDLIDIVTEAMDIAAFLPAVGQGAIGIETREGDDFILALLKSVHDEDTACALACERAFLCDLDGSCHTPIAGHACLDKGVLYFKGLVSMPDGSQYFSVSRSGLPDQAEAIGIEAAQFLRAEAGQAFFDAIKA